MTLDQNDLVHKITKTQNKNRHSHKRGLNTNEFRPGNTVIINLL